MKAGTFEGEHTRNLSTSNGVLFVLTKHKMLAVALKEHDWSRMMFLLRTSLQPPVTSETEHSPML
jgi:hypothetical protein